MKFLLVVLLVVTWHISANQVEAFHVGKNPYYIARIDGEKNIWPVEKTKFAIYKILSNNKQPVDTNEKNASENEDGNSDQTSIKNSKGLDENYSKNESFKNKNLKNKIGIEYSNNGRDNNKHLKHAYIGKCNCTCESVGRDDDYQSKIDDYGIKRDTCRCECLSSKTKLGRVFINPLASQNTGKYQNADYSKSENYPAVEYGRVLKEGDGGYNADLNYQNTASTNQNANSEVPHLDEKPQDSFLDYPHNNCYRSSCMQNSDCCRMFNICDPSAKVCIDCWHGMYCTTWKDCCFKHPYCEQKTLNKTSSEEDVKNGISKYKLIVEGRCVGKKPLNHEDIGL